MKRCLADVNVLLPLLIPHHTHHQAALRWFNGLEAGEAVLCRMVQMAIIRLLGNRTVMSKFAVSASSAWDLIAELLEDERLEFVAEPVLIDSVLPKLLRYSVPTHKLVSDAYLAAFSIAATLRLATFDRGFEQFRGVDLQLLVAA